MTRRVVHSGHEPGPRAIQSALCGYRAAGVITVGYTGLSRANLAVSERGVLHQTLLIDRVAQQAIFDLRDVHIAKVVNEIAPRSVIRPIPEMKATTPPISSRSAYTAHPPTKSTPIIWS